MIWSALVRDLTELRKEYLTLNEIPSQLDEPSASKSNHGRSPKLRDRAAWWSAELERQKAAQSGEEGKDNESD